jgi:type I restriction enzyme S subunit
MSSNEEAQTVRGNGSSPGQHARPYLRNVNVQWDHIDTYDLLEMDFKPVEQPTFRLHAGDVLICEGGEVGLAAIWNGQIEECYYQKALHRLYPNSTIASADFVVLLLWPLARSGVLLGSSTHATIAHLTGVQLKNLRVICPPIDLQDEFVQQMAQYHSIQFQQIFAMQKAENTFNALLAQVFSNYST